MGDKGAAVADDMGEGIQCMDHPYQANPGGICAFCLQEKLGMLVSSSKLSGPFFPLQPPLSPSSYSPPPSAAGVAPAYSDSAAAASSSQRKKKSSFGGASISGRKVSAAGNGATAAFATGASNDTLLLKRSKSVAPRPIGGSLTSEGGGSSRLAGAEPLTAESPRKKSFWSFLYSSSPSSSSASLGSNANNNTYSNRRRSTSSSGIGAGRGLPKQQQQQLQAQSRDDAIMARKDNGNELDEAGSPSSGSQASSSFGRKVARSRSVGCGSRSFSGDFLERISTGLGDCALRRVESHREAKAKIVLHLDHGFDDDEDEQQLQRRMNERVKCGGLFGGFGMMSSSLWLSAGLDDDLDNGKRITAATPAAAAAAAAAVVRGVSTAAPNGRTRSWGWTFASPMRAFRPASAYKHPYAIKSNAAVSTGATTATIITPITTSRDKSMI